MFFAYVLVDGDKTLFFVNESQVDESVRRHLGPAVEIHPYDSFFSYLAKFGQGLKGSVRLPFVALISSAYAH